jgi:hypothetical protein
VRVNHDPSQKFVIFILKKGEVRHSCLLITLVV